MSLGQPSLFEPPVPHAPAGFRYQPELITPEEEEALAAQLATLTLKPFEFHGHLGLRQVTSFGWRYDYDRRQVGEADDLPPFLEPLRARAAGLAELDGLFVDPELWRGGVGRALLQAAEAQAVQAGSGRMHVMANPAALGFYHALGFSEVGEAQLRFGRAAVMLKALVG